MLAGALCYAELGSAHPNAGGEYHFLSRAYGTDIGVLFAWARCTVIQTGAIAAVSFVYADYASNIIPLGAYSPAIHAVIAVAVLTGVNLLGTLEGARTQVALTMLTVIALLAVIVAGLSTSGRGSSTCRKLHRSVVRNVWTRDGVRSAHLRWLERSGLSLRRTQGRPTQHGADAVAWDSRRRCHLLARQLRLPQRVRTGRIAQEQRGWRRPHAHRRRRRERDCI